MVFVLNVGDMEKRERARQSDFRNDAVTAMGRVRSSPLLNGSCAVGALIG